MSVPDGMKRLKITDPIYASLATRDEQIRVLELLPGRFADRIEARLHPVFLKDTDAPRFEALSYVWGIGPSTSRVFIGDDISLSLPITKNLEAALRHLRDPDKPRVLWIDALCINQMDMQERGAQVQLMASIYSSAQNVVVWLGPEDTGSEFLEGLVQIKESLHDSSLRWDQHASHMPNTMYRLLKRPWFERTWVVQELALSKHDPVVIVGHHQFPWEVFIRCASDILEKLDRIPELDYADYKDRFEYAAELDTIRSAKRTPTQLNSAFFAYQLNRTLYLAVTDPRDKIFGLLGISVFESEPILPDYAKSVQEVYAEATRSMLLNRYVSTYFESPLRPLQDRHVRLSNHRSRWPSWVPNFTYATKEKRSRKLFNAARLSYQPLLQAPMDNLPFMLNIFPDERVNLLSQSLPPNLAIAEFSSDNTTMSTYGLFAGTIITTSKNDLQHLEWTEPPWLSLNSVYDIYHEILAPNGVSPEDYLRVLLPSEHRNAWRNGPISHQFKSSDFDNFLNADREDIQEYSKLFASNYDPVQGEYVQYPMKDLAEAITSNAKGRIIFITKEGHVGLSYHEKPVTGIRTGDLFVGLFGVNFPFILRRVHTGGDEVTHRIINVASVADHEWGHDFLGNTFSINGLPAVKSFSPDVTWRDFEAFGMRKYVVI